LIVFTGLGVVLVGAGLYMRRQAAPAGGRPALSSSGPVLSSSGPSLATLAPPAAPGTLRVTGGPLAGNTFKVDPTGLRIGRDPAACQIVLSETSVSREHAVIRPNGGSLSIKNLSGTNPTYVNDRAIQEATLTGGDKVKIGDSVFMVEA
jgi:pSer/pThr/pTyr-binding forkhead associated (FHA) protein